MTPPATPSRRTHGYYRKVIVRHVAAYCGYESHADAHRALKAGFYGLHPDDPALPSMRSMTQEEATRFIDWSLREAAEMGLVLEDPKKENPPDERQQSRFSVPAPAQSPVHSDPEDGS